MNAPRMLIRASLCWCSVWVPVGNTATAFAQQVQQTPLQANEKASEELYRSGLELVRRARYSAACRKFEASRQLQQTLENTLQVAQCHKQVGQSAAAWRLYRAAVALARARGEAQAEKAASKAADALEPELAHLTVDISEARVPGLQILRNGVPVRPELLGQPMAVDSGEHTIEATAPSKTSWSTRVDMQSASSKTVGVPLLEDESRGAPEASRGEPTAIPTRDSGPVADRSNADSWNVGKTLAVVGGAIGLAGTTLAVVQGIKFQNEKAEHERLQATVNRCGNPNDPCEIGSPRYEAALEASAQSREVREDASRALYRSVAGVIIGGSGFLAGAMMWFTVGQQHSAPRAALRVQPLASSRLTGISVRGSW